MCIYIYSYIYVYIYIYIYKSRYPAKRFDCCTKKEHEKKAQKQINLTCKYCCKNMLGPKPLFCPDSATRVFVIAHPKLILGVGNTCFACMCDKNAAVVWRTRRCCKQSYLAGKCRSKLQLLSICAWTCKIGFGVPVGFKFFTRCFSIDWMAIDVCNSNYSQFISMHGDIMIIRCTHNY